MRCTHSRDRIYTLAIKYTPNDSASTRRTSASANRTRIKGAKPGIRLTQLQFCFFENIRENAAVGSTSQFAFWLYDQAMGQSQRGYRFYIVRDDIITPF